MLIPKKNQTLRTAAQVFFDYLGTRLPYHCASDEFYFLPRSEKAAASLGSLDDLRPEKISELVARVESLLSALPPAATDDLEARIDRLVVVKCMKRFLCEFGILADWRTDPTLYVKIPLFATDEVMSRQGALPEELRAALSRLFEEIPVFLQQALNNLCGPSALAVDVARRMASDALRFYQKDVPVFIYEKLSEDPELLAGNSRAQAAWSDYQDGLGRLETRQSFAVGDRGLSEILATCVDFQGSPQEVLQLAEQGFRSTLEKIRALASRIDSSKPWQELVRDSTGSAQSPGDILGLYQQEVRALREFFYSRNLITFPAGERVEVLPTPSCLQSLRATASYRAPLTGQPDGTGVFYITPGPALSGLVLSHKPYLSAHETYPGHHVLDTVRLHHPNPVRRQIESPLYYEGWATYAESLLDEFGYTSDPRQTLVQLQRQLWRDLRSVLDVKLQTEAISMQDAELQIRQIGFSAETATRQVRRFALTPGYQSCYFLGMREIIRLRDRFSPSMGIRAFHDTLLEGGQLPFDLVEKRLENSSSISIR